MSKSPLNFAKKSIKEVLNEYKDELSSLDFLTPFILEPPDDMQELTKDKDFYCD